MKTIPQAIMAAITPDTIADAFVPLLHFALTDSTDLYYANYSQDVTYGGQTYTAWPFEGTMTASGKGADVVTVQMVIHDACRVLRPYAIRTNWFRQCQLRLVFVCLAHPSESYTWSTLDYDIKHAAPQGESISLRLGGPNITKIGFPPDAYYVDQCPYARGFKSDPRCGYGGSETTCSGSLADCIERDNETRFGGFWGLDEDAARLVLPFRMPGGI